MHRPFDEFHRFKTVPFRPNTALGFLNLGEAYHGVEPVAQGDWRDLIQLTIYIRAPGGGLIVPDD
ncbi:MAG: hypothetical protein FJX35_03820 [Alphaproteobacteria bacterium]|nr:hypothetical protein [Alphaproteobacteria bacterium]